MTIGETFRRYGRPALTAETPEAQAWECEERQRYFRLLVTSLENQLTQVAPFSDEYEAAYSRLLEAVASKERYTAELCLRRIKAAAENELDSI